MLWLFLMLSKGEKHVEVKNKWYESQYETKGCTKIGEKSPRLTFRYMVLRTSFSIIKKGEYVRARFQWCQNYVGNVARWYGGQSSMKSIQELGVLKIYILWVDSKKAQVDTWLKVAPLGSLGFSHVDYVVESSLKQCLGTMNRRIPLEQSTHGSCTLSCGIFGNGQVESSFCIGRCMDREHCYMEPLRILRSSHLFFIGWCMDFIHRHMALTGMLRSSSLLHRSAVRL